jgi:hypothetical protein
MRYDEQIAAARAAGDLAKWTEVVLAAASAQVFGTEPGRLPAELHDVLVRTTDDADWARVATALARCWAYAGRPDRAVPLADEAVGRAERVGRPELVADCLDAALAAHWGPDELPLRASLAGRLDDVTAHVLDPGARLQAHLWGLQIACELLDVQRILRQLRALDVLGEETPRARFFAETRRFMYDLLRGRTDALEGRIQAARAAEADAGLADGWMVIASARGYGAWQTGDATTAAEIADMCEQFALREGAATTIAEAAVLWMGAERPDRVGALVHLFRDRTLDTLPRDVNWLLTLQCLLEAALYVGATDLVVAAYRLLLPYAGRAVINAGAVMFHGVTDDPLSRAAAVLGDPDTAEKLREAALDTYLRIGAPWWHARLLAHRRDERIHFRRTADGVWIIGTAPMRPLKGFGYLRRLLSVPNTPVGVLELAASGGASVVQAPLERADRQALAAYRRRIADLEAELAEAREWSDMGRASALESEYDALLAELSAAAGLDGNPRHVGSSAERARVAVTKAISTAIERIAAVDPDLGRYLADTVHTGAECCYRPTAAAPHWVLD